VKIGLIAGNGGLPSHVIAGATESGFDVSTITFKGVTPPDVFTPPAMSFGIAELGGVVKYFKRQKCTHVCMAGEVTRPDFSTLKPDMKALKYLPGALAAAKRGDDALLTYIVQVFEKEGFEIISPQELCKSLLIGEGHMGAIRMSAVHRDDALKACEIASQMGALDIGQGAIVCDGLVLAVEAQEGTDELLRRTASLPETKRGSMTARKGVLAKLVKPAQEERVDLPTIGPKTVELAVKAGLAGIIVESGRAFCLDQAACVKAADEAGLFIVGIAAAKTS